MWWYILQNYYWYLHPDSHQLDWQFLDNWYWHGLLWNIYVQNELFYYHWSVRFQGIQCLIKIICEHRTLSYMCSFIFAPQTISIWAFNISSFIHSLKCVLVFKSLQDNISSILVVLEIIYMKLKHNWCPFVVSLLLLSEQ